MGRLEGSSRTSRSARGTDAFQVKICKQGNAVSSPDNKGKGVRKPMLRRAKALNIFNRLQTLSQMLDQRQKVFPVENRDWHKTTQSFDQPGDGGHIFGPGAAFIFVSAAEENRVRLQGRANIKKPGTFWAIELVGANGNEIGIELMDIPDRLFSEPLDGIRMKHHTA